MNIAHGHDEYDIRDLYGQLIDGFNAGDGSAFASTFDDDADIIQFDGTRLRGRKENAQAHQRLFDGALHGERLAGDVTSVRFIGMDVAIVIAENAVIPSSRSDVDPTRGSIQTFVVTKRENRWRFTLFVDTQKRESAC